MKLHFHVSILFWKFAVTCSGCDFFDNEFSCWQKASSQKKKKTSKSLKWPISYIFVILEISGNFLVILGFRGILGYFRDSGVFWPFFDRASWFFFFGGQFEVLQLFWSFKGFMDIYIYIYIYIIILRSWKYFDNFKDFRKFWSF